MTQKCEATAYNLCQYGLSKLFNLESKQNWDVELEFASFAK